MAPPPAPAAAPEPPPPDPSPFVEHPRDDDDNADGEEPPTPTPPRRRSNAAKPPLLVLAALALGGLVGLLLPADARHLPDPRYARASNVLGWAAFTAWSVSFWPQIVSNRRRKSVRGLSLDFVALNVLGFACYASFCALLYWNAIVAEEFKRRTGGASPVGAAVQLNDVAFALHALFAASLTALQCWWYDRDGGGQQQPRRSLAPATRMALLAAAGVIGAHALAARAATDAARFVAAEARRVCEQTVSAVAPGPWTLLDVGYTLSAVKMAVTLTKYVPQAAYNFSRRSTVGWSITNILLDFTGGLCSLAQQLLGAWWWRDLRSVVSANPVRFALSVVSLGFDLLFMVQHYVLFRAAWVGGDKAAEARRGRGEEDGGDAGEERRLLRGGSNDGEAA
jgi:cystinosin